MRAYESPDDTENILRAITELVKLDTSHRFCGVTAGRESVDLTEKGRSAKETMFSLFLQVSYHPIFDPLFAIFLYIKDDSLRCTAHIIR